MLAHQIPHQAKLTRYIEIAPDNRHFWFEVPDLESFDFIPGQFVSLSEMINGKKVTRAYSIASRPYRNTFELCLNEVHDGIFSPFLFRMNPGDTVEMKGPHGAFVMRKPVSDSIFVATGTGIAPFIPMLEHCLEKDSEHQYTLVFGVRYDHSVLYKDRLDQLDARYPNFKFICTVTRPGPDWKGNSGRIQQYVFPEIGDRRDIDIYICGLKEMVNDVRDRCKELGFDKKQIIYERYD
jgi:CDP-4-dehydro-6-deoxyglucose reductase, E3